MIIWIILFINVVCGMIAAAIYHDKGGEALTGFMAGLILGIFGIILVALPKADQKELDRRAVEWGQKRLCPFCKELIQPDAIVCPHCRSDLRKDMSHA